MGGHNSECIESRVELSLGLIGSSFSEIWFTCFGEKFGHYLQQDLESEPQQDSRDLSLHLCAQMSTLGIAGNFYLLWHQRPHFAFKNWKSLKCPRERK